MNLNDFAAALQVKFAAQDTYKGDNFGAYMVTASKGSRWAKVYVQRSGDNYSKFIHCFVEVATGHVYKPAGLKAPAAGVRYASMAEALEAADVFGRYLYR